MKNLMAVIAILLIACSFRSLKKNDSAIHVLSPFFLNDSNIRKPYDTSNEKTKDFKIFLGHFFSAVENKDFSYLRAHIIFPIKNSSLSEMDSSLKENDNIDEKYFFKNLHRLFPQNINKSIKKRGVFFAFWKGTKYHVRIYNHSSDEIDSTFTWFFVKKKGLFYFIQFQTEAY